MNLSKMIERFVPMFDWNPGGPIDRKALLIALLAAETEGGQRSEAAKFEPHLVPAIRRVHPEAYRRYGDRLAASYGPFQVLGVTAMELGMEGAPDRLAQPEIGCFWAIEYLNRRLSRPSHAFIAKLDERAQVRAIADLYNSGSASDANRPHAYIQRIIEAYLRAKQESA